MTKFPKSTVLDATPDERAIREIAEDALQAFFTVVCERLDDLYPEGKTTGDVDPLEHFDRERIAVQWVHSHALNHPTICTFNNEEEDDGEDADSD